MIWARFASRVSVSPPVFCSVAAIAGLVCAIWLAFPAVAMDPGQANEVVVAYPEMPIKGAKAASGLILWSHGMRPASTQSQPPPPFAIKALVASGWDAIKINRNPAREQNNIGAAQQHVNELAQQIGNAQQAGYSRVIVAGESYGGSLSVQVAFQVPVFGVIAMASFISQPAMLAQLQTIKASRALFVLPSDDEATPGVDQASQVRPSLNAAGSAYIMIDRQVHGHWGGYGKEFLPYATCSMYFFSPTFAPRPGEFQCYRDEMTAMFSSFGLSLNGATAAWIGYLDRSGQSVAIVEHRTKTGSTVDFACSGDLAGRTPARARSNLPAAWAGNVLTFRVSQDDALTLSPVSGANTWAFKASKDSGGDWGATLTLVAAAK